MDTTAVMVKCRSGCGRQNDMQAQVRIQKRLGLGGRVTWQCAECFKVEWPKIQAEERARAEAKRKVRAARA